MQSVRVEVPDSPAVVQKRSIRFAAAATSSKFLTLKSPALAENLFRILVFSWNVGNAQPNESDLMHWLPEAGGDLDFVVVGTQENTFKKKPGFEHQVSSQEEDLQDNEEEPHAAWGGAAGLQKKASKSSDRRRRGTVTSLTLTGAEKAHGGWGGAKKPPHAWDKMIADRLGDEWTVCAHVVLREMRLTVYCTREVAAKKVRHVATAYSATGIGGVIGNKGGLVARMTVGDTSLAFCSCHLAAHEGSQYLKSRNAMCQEILFETSGGRISGTKGKGRPLDVAHAVDHIIWLGDLNYRVDLNLASTFESLPLGHSPPEELVVYAQQREVPGTPRASQKEAHIAAVVALAEQTEFAALRKCDELSAAREAGDAFVDFREGELAFAPTFKVNRQPGTSYTMQRTPSYCDRILFKSMPPSAARLCQMNFTSVPEVATSDHKPVVSAFTLYPSVPVHRTPHGKATVKITISDLVLKDILASDFTGTSDPFCCFFTHPEGLLLEGFRGRPPRTSIKYRVRPGKNAAQTGDAAIARSLTRHLSKMQSSAGTGQAEARWSVKEVPTLHLCCPLESLNQVCLLVAIFDHDYLKPNDPMGVVTIPLASSSVKHSSNGAAAGSGASSSDGSEGVYPSSPPAPQNAATEPDLPYTIYVSKPIVHGHRTSDTGKLFCTVRVQQSLRQSSRRFVMQRVGTWVDRSWKCLFGAASHGEA